jgi:cytochrome c-type biogenesis protein CcmH/NrfG
VTSPAQADENIVEAPAQPVPAGESGSAVEPGQNPVNPLVSWFDRNRLLVFIVMGAAFLALLVTAMLLLVSQILFPGAAEPTPAKAEPSTGIPSTTVPPAAVPSAAADGVMKPAHAAQLEFAARQVQQGQLAEATSRLRQILHEDPQNAEAWFWLGAAAETQRQHRTAQRCYVRAKDLGHPRADLALRNLKI